MAQSREVDQSFTFEALDEDSPEEASMNTVTWLHVSDLHFRRDQQYDASIRVGSLLGDIETNSDARDLQPDLVMVTGHTVCTGDAAQYSLAREFFDRRLACTGGDLQSSSPDAAVTQPQAG